MPQIERQVEDFAVTIRAGQSLSDAVKVDGGVIFSIQMPDTWTTAGLSFEGSADGSTFYPVYDDGGFEVVVTSVNALAQRTLVNANILEKLAGLRAFKIRSGAFGAPVNQAADRILRVVAKG